MLELFVLGSFWFWVLLVVTFGLLTGYVNRNKDDDGKIATFFFVASLALFFFLGNKDLFFSLLDYIKNKPLGFIGYVAGYLSIGAVWSIVKWYYFLIDYKNKYLSEKSNYPNRTLTIPTASEYKSDIIMWMTYWTVSLFWTLIHQWVGKIWTKIYQNLEGVYNKISKNIFKDIIDGEVKKDF